MPLPTEEVREVTQKFEIPRDMQLPEAEQPFELALVGASWRECALTGMKKSERFFASRFILASLSLGLLRLGLGPDERPSVLSWKPLAWRDLQE